MSAYGAPGYFMSSGGQNQAVPMELPKNLIRVGEQGVWSTYRYTAALALASTQQRYFAVGIGGSGQGFTAGLSLAETNLKEQSRIPTGYAFDVHGIAAIIQGSTNVAVDGNDIRNMQNHGVLSWDFIQTKIDICPIMLIGAGGGLFGATADTGNAQTARNALNNGPGSYWIYNHHPVALPAGSTFNLLSTFGPSAQATVAEVWVKLCLLGAFQSAIEIG